MTAWSRERPSKAGWYWYRECEEIVDVLHVVRSFFTGICRVANRGNQDELDFYKGEWQGPLEPKE